KCLGKMQDVSRTGRTIIFVSHNMAAVTRLCPRCMLLSRGTMLKDGTTHEVMSMYLRSELETSAARQWSLADAPGDGIVRLRAVRVRSVEGRIAETFDIRQPIGIDVIFDVLRDGKVLAPNVHVFNEAGLTVFVTIDQDEEWHRRPRSVGRYVSTVWIPRNFLPEGSFTVDAAVTTFIPMDVHFHESAVVGFQIVDSTDGDSVRGDYGGTLPGVVRPMLQWETSFQPLSDDIQFPTAAEGKTASPASALD
ncbi:MAG TPA: ABC transporter ATP-binding protein, partial [Nitrospira sp.]|nr:ABC transporter ATP-binding protein [Nitrospira sp.]